MEVTRRDFMKAATYGIVAVSLSHLLPGKVSADTRCPRGDSIDRSSLREYQIVKETGMHPILGVMVGTGGVYYVLTSNVYKTGVEVGAFVIPEGPMDVNLIYDNDDSVRLEIEREKPFGYGNPYGSRQGWERMYGSSDQRNIVASDFFHASDTAYHEKCWNRAKTLLTQGVVIQPNLNYYWERLAESYVLLKDFKNGVRVLETGKKFCSAFSEQFNKLIMRYRAGAKK